MHIGGFFYRQSLVLWVWLLGCQLISTRSKNQCLLCKRLGSGNCSSIQKVYNWCWCFWHCCKQIWQLQIIIPGYLIHNWQRRRGMPPECYLSLGLIISWRMKSYWKILLNFKEMKQWKSKFWDKNRATITQNWVW